MQERIYKSTPRSVRARLFLLVLALTLGLGLSLAGTAHGAERAQGGGKLMGIVTVHGAGSAGITAELRRRANDGADTGVATTTTGEGGAYQFSDVASAPSDAFYYVRFSAAKDTLAAWYTFPIIYVQGSDFNVPTVEFGDILLLEPARNASLTLPGILKWSGRTAGETYRVFIYAEGQTNKPAHDSGSLGAATSYTLSEGALPDGRYEAVVQARDAVAGYGQSQSRFTFTIGAPPVQQPPASTDPVSTEGNTGNPPAQPEPQPHAEATVSPSGEGHDGSVDSGTDSGAEAGTGTGEGVNLDRPQVSLSLSADKTQVQPGDTLVYRIEVENRGGATAQGVVVTNLLPSGLTVDSARAHSSAGSIAVQGNTVTAQVGDLAPDAKVVVEIPVSVGKEVGSNISTQASAQYGGASDPVQSNAYIAQVAEPASAPPNNIPASPPQEKPQDKPQEQPKEQPQTKPQDSSKQQPPQSKPANTPQKNAPVPQTGGSFPILLAVALVIVTLLARYLRARHPRRV